MDTYNRHNEADNDASAQPEEDPVMKGFAESLSPEQINQELLKDFKSSDSEDNHDPFSFQSHRNLEEDGTEDSQITGSVAIASSSDSKPPVKKRKGTNPPTPDVGKKRRRGKESKQDPIPKTKDYPEHFGSCRQCKASVCYEKLFDHVLTILKHEKMRGDSWDFRLKEYKAEQPNKDPRSNSNVSKLSDYTVARYDIIMLAAYFAAEAFHSFQSTTPQHSPSHLARLLRVDSKEKEKGKETQKHKTLGGNAGLYFKKKAPIELLNSLVESNEKVKEARSQFFYGPKKWNEDKVVEFFKIAFDDTLKLQGGDEKVPRPGFQFICAALGELYHSRKEARDLEPVVIK